MSTVEPPRGVELQGKTMEGSLAVIAELTRSIQKLACLKKDTIQTKVEILRKDNLETTDRNRAQLEQLSANKELREILDDLLHLRRNVDEALLETTSNTNTSQVDLCQILHKHVLDWDPMNEDVQERRGDALTQLDSSTHTNNNGSSVQEVDEDSTCDDPGLTGVVCHEPKKLVSVLNALRRAERGVNFHSQMVQEATALASTTRYTTENFAYGSTPLQSWIEVFENPKVRPHIEQTILEGKEYAVWGSSAGWLAFYGRLVYGLKTTGIELLKTHVDLANRVASANGVDGVRFVHGDFLNAQLDSTGILMLTSQCWDDHLIAKVQDKVAKELPLGSVCIDYTPALTQVLGDPIAIIDVEVSWNSDQKIHVYLKL